MIWIFFSARPSFLDQVEAAIDALVRSGYRMDNSSDSIKTGDYCTFVVYDAKKPENLLKLDFVNDIAAQFGGTWSG